MFTWLGESILPAWGAAVLALLPACVTWWRDRRLLRLREDPALPERLLARQQRVVGITTMAAVLLIVLGLRSIFWSIPLLWLASQVPAHRLRRALFGDTWRFTARLAWAIRAILAVPAFWILLAFGPLLLVAAGAPDWAGLPLGAVLLAWNHAYPAILLRVLGARPIEGGDVPAAFEPVLSRTAIPRPALWRAGPRGALLANALALPARGRSSVLFFDSLLEHLSPAESAAILAHEVAHLEYYRGWPLLRLSAINVLVVLGGAALLPAARALGVDPYVAAAVWPAAALAALAARGVGQQQRETESDRRAVELCGDGEALASALTTLHALSRVPRRWRSETERYASHPSLARRLQAIRAMAPNGAASRSIEAPRAFPAAAEPRVVVFDADRAAFLTFAPSIGRAGLEAGLAETGEAAMTRLTRDALRLDAVPYADVHELRLAPRSGGAADLVCADRLGRRWTIGLRPQDVAAVQAVLDLVDQRLAPVSADPSNTHAWGRAAASLALLASLAVSLWAIAVPALLALLRPRRHTLGALAAAGFALACLAHRLPVLAFEAMALTGCAAVICAWAAARQTPGTGDPLSSAASPPRERLEAAVLAAAPLLMLAFVGATAGGDAYRWYAGLRASPSVVTGLAAFATYGLLLAGPARRWVPAGAGAAAVLLAFVGSGGFRERFAPDPLIGGGPRLAGGPLELEPVARLQVPGFHQRVRVSPDGRRVLLTPIGDADHPVPATLVVARVDGGTESVAARSAVFMRDGRLLRLERRGADALLATEPTAAAQAWEMRIPDTDAADVAIDADRGGWHLEAELETGGEADDFGRRTFERIEGLVGGDALLRRRFVADAGSGAFVWTHLSTAGPHGLAVAREWNARLLPYALFVGQAGWRSILLQTGPAGSRRLHASALDVACSREVDRAASVVCFAAEPDATRIVAIDAATGVVDHRATVPGRLSEPVSLGGGMVLGREPGALVLVSAGLGRVVQLDGLPGCGGAIDADHAGETLAVLSARDGNSHVALYRLSPQRMAAGR